jgi:1,4-alpha-glucan branching enzyme
MKYEEVHFVDSNNPVWNYSLFNEENIKMFQLGELFNAHEYFGSKKISVLNKEGYYFAVWAPHATSVHVMGDFNKWNKSSHKLFSRLDHSGIWEGFIPAVNKGEKYKYYIIGANGIESFKADPYANYAELRPQTASIAWDFSYKWGDKTWMKKRKKKNSLQAPWNVYEMHLGSWMRPNKYDEHSFNSYHQIAERLVPYLIEMGFTHVELMPVMEFPYDKSWGYQCTGYFAATSRFGSPEGLMHLIEELHKNDIGVILDWVPSHFPSDAHGLYMFDGAHTYEYADKRKGFHPDWNSYIFNYARGEVRSFLISSAHFWLKYFHADGLRVDAVNSIIRLDFSRKKGEWEPNEYGGNENIEAIHFLKRFNEIIYREFNDVQTIAEEASDWPGITLPTSSGGFGFGMKWMMGWMHDTFKYFKTHHHHRIHLQDKFSFSMMYFYDENFMLPLSHDEVVHGKSPMIYKMPGLEHEKFATLRLLYGYMYMHPGAKLLFMGNEFGQTTEWNEAGELDWHLLQFDSHRKLKEWVKVLSKLYKNEPALYEYQFDPRGFEWIELNRRAEGVIMFKRKGLLKKNDLLIVMNMSANNYTGWSIQIEGKLKWEEIFNSNHLDYWGTGTHLNKIVPIKKINVKNKIGEINISIPALSIQVFR